MLICDLDLPQLTNDDVTIFHGGKTEYDADLIVKHVSAKRYIINFLINNKITESILLQDNGMVLLKKLVTHIVKTA